jgi:hypothetical protein
MKHLASHIRSVVCLSVIHARRVARQVHLVSPHKRTQECRGFCKTAKREKRKGGGERLTIWGEKDGTSGACERKEVQERQGERGREAGEEMKEGEVCDQLEHDEGVCNADCVETDRHGCADRGR